MNKVTKTLTKSQNIMVNALMDEAMKIDPDLRIVNPIDTLTTTEAYVCIKALCNLINNWTPRTKKKKENELICAVQDIAGGLIQHLN